MKEISQLYWKKEQSKTRTFSEKIEKKLPKENTFYYLKSKSFKCIKSGAEMFGFRNFVLRTSLSFSFPLTTKISWGYRLFYIFKDYRNFLHCIFAEPLVFLNISQGKSQHHFI